jgi:hypothetical protein
MLERKRRLPVLLGMNVLGQFSDNVSVIPTCLQAVIREAHVDKRTSVKGLARVATDTFVPALSMATVRVTSTPDKRLLYASPVQKPLPQGLILVPTLVDEDPTQRYVRIANLSSVDCILSRRTVVATLHAVDGVDSQNVEFTVEVNEMVVSIGNVSAEKEAPVVNKTATESSSTDCPTSTPKIQCPDFDGTASQKQKLQELLNKHAAGFIQDPTDLGYSEVVQHRLKTTDEVPVAQPYRRIPPNQLKEVQDHIRGLLEQKVIVESHSAYAAPVVVCRKKDNSIRLCVDYRKLNAKTIGDAYPLPRIQESFDALVGAQYFSTLDLASGYYQIAIAPEDRHKTAFATPMGLFEYTRMPMGLMSAPATFQRLMQTTMSEFMFSFLLVYLDDLLVYSTTFEEHLEHLDRLLGRIVQTGLKLKMKKCQFLRREVKYLGHTISAEGVSCDQDKVEVIKNWPKLNTATDVRRFLGFASYFRRFICGFAKIAGPLHELVTQALKDSKKKTVDITRLWTERHQTAFDTLKAALSSAPVLAFADFTLPFILETDASNDGLGAILSQEQDGRKRVIAYASHRLRPTAE